MERPSLFPSIRNASVLHILTAIVAFVFLRWIVRGIYRVYFHPLSKFPGPKFSAFTRIPHLKSIWTGKTHLYVRELHEQYGDVVRISPDELSYAHPNAWRDIFGKGVKGTPGSVPPKHFVRYSKPANGVEDLIVSDDTDHARMRRIFSTAFSDKALKQQEPLFMQYADKLIKSLRDHVKEDADAKLDLSRFFNLTTFDVMGDLSFGESLHMLDSGEYDPWVSVIFESVRKGIKLGLLFWYPVAATIFQAMAPRSISRARDIHFQYAVDRVTKRLEKGRASEGVDLWTLVLGRKEGEGLSRGEMDCNASLFMVAGTETTATLLSGLTYLLLKNPVTYKKLVQEIRAAFASPADINMEGAAALPYLNACVKEALRRYPPVAAGLPHLTPSDGSTICGQFVPPRTTVAIPHFGAYNTSINFRDPLAFVPERWLGDERYANDRKAVFQPFQYGTRDCLGRNMAYHEMRLIISKVLYNFDLELCPESDNWMNQDTYIIWEKPPLMVKLKDRGVS
ncbi:cytochrome P450 [Westerdykella ornata]|uniref:Cytochrome P450 n=1 Tax=Westerdykella ornata TaxID=318751 RepID=A0A6A6JVZ0_WESOR|nr:cytochrome P450 [Westerdykella ornata]KAF2280273.1 cytochrome P450 [Westerdykella ornata]